LLLREFAERKAQPTVTIPASRTLQRSIFFSDHPDLLHQQGVPVP